MQGPLERHSQCYYIQTGHYNEQIVLNEPTIGVHGQHNYKDIALWS